MPRYIDAEKAEKDGWSASRIYQYDAKTNVYETKKMTDFPTADVVEVVRCKYCKHRKLDEWYYVCELDTGDLYELGRNAEDDNWFCADGERKNN